MSKDELKKRDRKEYILQDVVCVKFFLENVDIVIVKGWSWRWGWIVRGYEEVSGLEELF